MTALIFGVNGQDGYYLKNLLESLLVTVYGFGRDNSNITSYLHIADLVKTFSPDYIFHLAANSTTRHEVVLENHDTITTGTVNILEAVKNHSSQTRVFISGSGLQFENKGRPIKETDPFEARDAYSMSRIASVYTARYYRSLGIQTYVGYLFNHDSPRRSERHMAKKIVSFARQVGLGNEGVLEIGDWDVVKEWGFAGDIVEGMWKLVNQEDVFEANIGTGKGYSIKEWVDACFELIGKDPALFVKEKPGFKPEYRQLVSDPQRIMQLGFAPHVSFFELARLMMQQE